MVVCASVLLAPAAALATGGPDPTLVVASVPDPSLAGGSGDVVQTFDTATGSALGSVPDGVFVGSNPFALAITPNGSTSYVANNLSGTVTPVAIASSGAQTSLCLPLGNCLTGGDPGTSPEAVAVTPDGSAAYVANSGEDTISEIAITGGVAKVLSPPIRSSSFAFPDATAITPNGQTVWVANYSAGTVVPVSLPSDRIGTPIVVGLNPTALAITPDGRHLMVADSGDGTVSDVSLAASPVTVHTFALEPTADGFVTPQAIAIAPDGVTAYVTDTTNDVVVPVTTVTDGPGDPVAVGTYPTAVAVSPDNSTAYVADQLSDDVSVLDLTAGAPSVSTTIAVDGEPDALASTPDQAPKASFTVTPGTAGSPTTFDASSAATTPAGGTLTYVWSFGDGSAPATTSGATIDHVYANPGTYTATLTVTDAAGTSTTQVFTGQTVSRNGGPSATTSQPLAVEGAASGAGPEAIVVDGSGATATPVALLGGPPPSAAPGIATGVGAFPSAVAIDPAGKIAYVVDTDANKVTPVDMTTGQAQSPATWITVGNGPNAIAITPDGRYAYVVDGASTSLTRITLQTHAVATIAVPAAAGANLDAIAIAPDGSAAYVLDAADNTVTRVNIATSAVGSPVAGTGLVAPDAIAIAPDGRTAYVVDGGSSTQAGGITTVDVSGSTPHPGSTKTLDTAGDHPDAIAISPAGGVAYLVDAPTNGHAAAVVALTLSTTSVTAAGAVTIAGAGALYGIAVTPDGTSAYATGRAKTSAGGVIVPIAVSGATATPASPASLGGALRAIAIAPDQAPVADLSVSSPVAAGDQETLDASASSNPSSPIASYRFDFGDGTAAVSTAASSVMHAYAVAGTYTATVTVTDRAGTSTTRVFTGQTVSRDGGPGAAAGQGVSVVPTIAAVGPSSGPPGTRVTITGTGFSTAAGATTVGFGATPGTAVTCGSTKTCTVTAPSGSGSVAVSATVGGQTSPAVPEAGFTYVAAAGLTVTQISPTHGPAGTRVTLTGSGFSTAAGATKVSFGTTRASLVSCSSTTTCAATAPAGRDSITGASVAVTATVGTATSPPVAGATFTYGRF